MGPPPQLWASKDQDGNDKHSFLCLNELDAVYYCTSPFHQFEILYKDGIFDNCQGLAYKLLQCSRGLELVKTPPSVSSPTASIWQFKTRPRFEYGDADAPPPAPEPAAAA
ncbi:hypothetical protein M885DRAFT_512082 [Pelagophyceae sp. CCMP2097]|nr:hypothetical protein M885DRAFT_512082 [Pelagophyceae sp. CCMP2097]|mmetsp:Transcript_1948/g.6949  ORF Transcript_1948/g.6949 Transcript_1948/m.6949 type:complete len:110 (-) Transcript_1948:87-416(-)